MTINFFKNINTIFSRTISFAQTCKSTYTTKARPVAKRIISIAKSITSVPHNILVWVINFIFSIFLPKEAEKGCKKVLAWLIPVALVAGIYLMATGTTFTTVLWGLVIIMAPKFIINNLNIK